MISGNMFEEFKVELRKFKNYDVVAVSSWSKIRFFKTIGNNILDTGVEKGNSIILADEIYSISYPKSRGTQTTIKFSNPRKYSQTKFERITQVCLDWTYFHLSDKRVNTKIPYPLHLSQKIIMYLRNQEINKIEFKFPLYLGGSPN